MMRKKEYKKPLTEMASLEDSCTLMANTVIQDDWADAKQNIDIIFEEDDLFNSSSWNTDPWKTDYNLWDEEN